MGDALGEGMSALRPLSIPCPMHLFHLTVPELYPLITKQSFSKRNVSLSSVSHSSKLIKPTEGVVGTSNLWQVSHVPVTTRTYDWHLELER